MLRLKQAMDELKIPQQAFVAASGWSKTQVSLTLNSGKLPANAGKFAADVQAFAETRPELIAWLGCRGLTVPALCDNLAEPAADNSATADLERALCEVAGRAVLMVSVPRETVIGLARVAGLLLDKLHSLAGADAPYTLRIEAKACAMLAGAEGGQS
ncbi:MAG: hypothetical protein OEL57_02250 [Trichlorobacter sp.]|uniref:hypothetical protein n=1 Tax=Trichlorobacter sp. TaxID=2911007 RepID=UPI0025633241|nr:hypothetical protein [Trichlorobacter sp.]MDK9716712.1 hypothetical protein [Trichlorobacter sp.]